MLGAEVKDESSWRTARPRPSVAVVVHGRMTQGGRRWWTSTTRDPRSASTAARTRTSAWPEPRSTSAPTASRTAVVPCAGRARRASGLHRRRLHRQDRREALRDKGPRPALIGAAPELAVRRPEVHAGRIEPVGGHPFAHDLVARPAR